MTKQTQSFSAISDSARTYGRADSRVADAKAKAVAAYRAAGQESDAMKTAFLSGYMQGALGLAGADADSKARAIMDKKGFGAKAKANARRTEKQESVYASARQALKRVRDAAGVKPADQRGTTSNPGKGKDAKTESEKVKAGEKKSPATMIPAATTPKDAAAFMLAYANKNPKAFAGPEGKALQRAIMAFAKAQAEPSH